ncbi:aromatic-ring-hydroxylating dioxygenase subunit beta [Robbsia sp. KACC 23696]|uniref:aromatic-ring-hydroxylating dioxygenase subunit beta n=1 Tax=Robbsia sp. KACC 23696 TaxID=3149231 RepID=UPI00325A53F0
MTATSPAFAAAIELIWREAELLDRKDYSTWLTLWTDSGHYTVPIDQQTTDFASTLNYVYDDHVMRGLRVERMTCGFSASATDAARTVRSVSRFTKAGEPDADNIIEVRSSQIVAACKRGTTTMFAADLTHRIALGTTPGAEAKIIDKVIRLVDSEEALNAIGFLL